MRNRGREMERQTKRDGIGQVVKFFKDQAAELKIPGT